MLGCWSRSNMSHNFLDNQWPINPFMTGQGTPPVQVDGRDDLTGEPLVQRDDDKPEAVRARLQDSSTMIVSDCEWFMKNIEPFHLCLHQPNWKKKCPFCKRKQTRWCNPFTFIWGVWQPDLALVTVLQGHGGIEVNLTLIQGMWWHMCVKNAALLQEKGCLYSFDGNDLPDLVAKVGLEKNTEIFSVMKIETFL